MSQLPHKKPAVAWAWWMTFGWIGAHRFYLERRGALMMVWFVAGLMAAAALDGTVLPEFVAPGVWFGSVLLWWSIDALLIPRWTRELQAVYADVAEKLESESMVEVLTLPLMRAAQKHGGKLTVAEGVLATGLTIVQIEATLMEMAKTGYVQIENTDRGDLRFDFGDLPEYDEDEAMREAEMEARELAVEEAAMMMEEEREQAVRGQRSAALKGGLAAGVAAVGVRALMGGLLGDDEGLDFDDE